MTDHERNWLPEGTEAPERERITVQSRKMMTTIVQNPTGFCGIVALPKGMKFNAGYHISHMLDPLAEWRRSQIGGSDRRLHVHADNACPHTGKNVTEFFAGNGMKRAPTGPGTCHFYLLGCIKGRLACASFEEPDEPLQPIDAIFSPLQKPIGTCVSGVDGQIGAMLCGSWWFRRRDLKTSWDDPSFTRPV
jgi:hypothetical protein